MPLVQDSVQVLQHPGMAADQAEDLAEDRGGLIFELGETVEQFSGLRGGRGPRRSGTSQGSESGIG